jgi:hypothetical protein
MDWHDLALKNWRTSILGLGSILTAVGDLLTQLGSGHFDANKLGPNLVAIFLGIGLICARDARVSEREHREDRERQ